ncbi:MFS transporter [Rubellicoccus peritrichatus]|uniref:MFS transporter n=1 Tax=Rubellicoccus peritrichatus TaxID=3080537 RepID=A0AAQ3LFL5_9BACT|nr:MFS transporter [Puniceicoccus sp. CR14]WOO41149.1 MFS transporter [Puniceicoccus sp. CR14]
MASSTPVSSRKQALAGAVGNLLEWFDFAAYGFFAAVIGARFFPNDDETISLLAAFGVFASGFIARPIGAAFFGHIGDRMGREVVLRWSVILMGSSTFLMGILPTYDSIGIVAPILLTLLRILQGFSVGGELTGSIVYMVEHAPADRRGFTGSLAFVGAYIGILLGSVFGAFINNLLTPEQVAQWGWRLPFLCGICIMFLAVFFRRDLKKSGNIVPSKHLPLLMAFKSEWKAMLRIIGMLLFGSSGFYMIFIYLTTYMHTELGMAEGMALEVSSFAMLALIGCTLGMAKISDRIGRKPVLLTASVGCVFFTYPLFILIDIATPIYVFFGQLGFAILIGSTLSAMTAMMVECTAPEYRCTTVSLAYNFTLAAFGGTAPMVATWLISESGNRLEPAFYLMITAAITSVTVFFLPETYRMKLRDGQEASPSSKQST